MLMADNQWIAPPAGTTRVKFTDQLTIGGAISPDGTKFATASGSGTTGAGLRIVDLASGTVLQNLPVNGTSGILYSPDGKTLWVSQGVSGVLRYEIGSEGTITNPTAPVTVTTPSNAYPAGIALSADGSKLYVAFNGTNTLGVIDTATNTLTKEIPVGNAPREVVISAGKAFVSNQGGRKAVSGDTTDNSYGTPIVSDPSTATSTTGTVSVVNLENEEVSDTINVGLEPAAETLDGNILFVANNNSDSISIINTESDKVTQTFNVEPLPGSTVGSSPNSITMPDPHHLLVSVGRDNALAEFAYNGPIAPVKYEGLIPTDWYPDQVRYDSALNKLVVSNLRGIGNRGPEETMGAGAGTEPAGNATGHATHTDVSTLDIMNVPSPSQLGALTRDVFSNNGWNRLEAEEATPPSGRHAAPQAIPRRLGEPSPIKHVFLVVKENRTYDQVLGDIGKGNSDPADAQYGQRITPNEHNLANKFSLFDNFYDSGSQSADGHQWLVQGNVNDYDEVWNQNEWVRSYPYNGGDPMIYQRDGFLWNAAERAHKSVENYGEYEAFGENINHSWQEWWQDAKVMEGKTNAPMDVPLNSYKFYSDVPSLNKITNHAFPEFDLEPPDQFRIDVWEQDFKKAEETGNLPNLTIMTLPDDHTGGAPTPIAEQADNDLAVGRLIGDISHSKFWKSSAVFVVEDDSQAGVDHVDGHRSVLWVASPYAKRGVINNEYFTQVNVVKTAEQILGIQPMNQMDRAAMPMFSAFTNTPNYAPYEVVHNQIPLTLGVKGAEAETKQEEEEIAELDAKTGTTAPSPAAITKVAQTERSVADAWTTWKDTVAKKHLTGSHAAADSVNPRQLNRYDWYTSHGWSKPYPGDSKILKPSEVPGRNLPVGYLGED